MSFRFKGLHSEQFSSFVSLSDADLEAVGGRRMIADTKPGFPCRITLDDAEPGESVLLLNFEHQPAHSPYRAQGPIFIRETATEPFDAGTVPPALRPRLLSLRAYDEDGMIVEAGVAQGTDIEGLLDRLFARPDTAYIHVHYAARGCFAVLVERA